MSLRQNILTERYSKFFYFDRGIYIASFPGLSGEGGKAWGLLRAHARKLPQNVVIAYYSNLSATFVSILSVKACERG